MEVLVFRNPLALRFVRCVSKVPGVPQYAGGAGFTLHQAIERCDSEVVERKFHHLVLFPAGIRPLGIAAHRIQQKAQAHAIQEVIETLCIEQIHSDGVMYCLATFRAFGLTIGLARSSHGYLSVIRGTISGIKVAAHTAGPRLLSTLLKTWEEFQSMRFFRPSSEKLRGFTKVNRLFSQDELNSLKFKFEPRRKYQPNLDGLQTAHESVEGREIVYFYKPKKENC